MSAEKFWDKKAQGYAASPISDMDAYNKTMTQTRAHLSEGDRVLEVGCGSGSTALLLADCVGHITGSDISGNMVQIAKDKAGVQQVGNADFVQATLDDGQLGAETYDAVLAFNLLHLLEDLPTAIGQINKRLKPGGYFISKTVMLSEGSALWRLAIPIMRMIGVAPPVKSLSQGELDAAILSSGFEIVDTHGYAGSFKTRFIVAKKI
ncbi:MAG: class I SAM-dependent methyltransferase [Parvibaculaceae bacterium]|nr:class I SAM-dependent methyltransferase [Parvibaculaceae bacterium]